MNENLLGILEMVIFKRLNCMSSHILYLCDLESMTIIIEDNKDSNFFPSEWNIYIYQYKIEIDTSETFCIPDKRLPMNKH